MLAADAKIVTTGERTRNRLVQRKKKKRRGGRAAHCKAKKQTLEKMLKNYSKRLINFVSELRKNQ